MTPKQLTALPHGTHPIKQHPGLRLEVRQSTRSWTLRRRDAEGKLKQQVLGHYPTLSLAGAIAAAEDARRASPKAQCPASPIVVTVRALVHSYCIEHIRLRRKDWQHSEALIWRHVGELSDRDAGGVTRAEAHRFLTGLAVRPAIQRVMKMELSAAWEHAMMAGALPDGANPWSKVKVAPPGRKDRFLTDAEVSRLISWLRTGGVNETVRDVLLITLGSGCRSGEVAAMRCCDLDLVGGTWTLPTTKNGLGRIVYLNGFVLNVLRGRDLTGEHAFVVNEKPIRQQMVSNAVHRSRAGKECPVKNWTPHDLRRTCRTGLAKLGCPTEIGELLLGHAVGGVRAVYDLYRYGKEQREWAEKWGRHLQQLAA